MNRFIPLLREFGNKKIKHIDVNIKNETIKVEIEEGAFISFEGVSSFFYMDADQIDFANALLDSIEYSDQGFGEFVAVDPLEEEEDQFSIPNFSLAVLNKSMLIEAKAIAINGNRFQLGKITH